MTTWPIQNKTHRTLQKHQDAQDIQNKLFYEFFGFFYFYFILNFLNDFFKKCLVLSHSKPHTFIHVPVNMSEGSEVMCAYPFLMCPLLRSMTLTQGR